MTDTIVIVEDDSSIREMLRYYFQSTGHGVRAYESGEDLFSESEKGLTPSIYLLDIMLPGMSGLDILRHLRSVRETAEVPVIMLTARSAEMDRVEGLEAGADDYLVKPFGLMELQARVKAVLRRTRRSSQALRCGDLSIDVSTRTVHLGGVPVDLTYKEFELLRLLASRRGVVFSREDILRAVWDYDGFTGETRTVDMHIKSLRQKLGDDLIATVRGVGYKLN